MRSITLHKTSCIYTYFWKRIVTNHGGSTEATREYGCRTFLACWSACLSLIFCKFPVDSSRFAPRGYGWLQTNVYVLYLVSYTSQNIPTSLYMLVSQYHAIKHKLQSNRMWNWFIRKEEIVLNIPETFSKCKYVRGIMLLLPFSNNYIISKMCHVLLNLDLATKKITIFILPTY